MRRLRLEIALALAAAIGTGGLMLSGVEAGSNEIVFRGDDSPGTSVAKPDERRLYSAFNQTPAVGKARKRRAGKPGDPTLSAPAEARHDNPPKELSWGSRPLDSMIPQR